MKFMSFVRSSEQNGPPPKALMDAIMAFGIEGMQKGFLVQQGGLYRSDKGGALVAVRKGKLTVTDGPFTETKEIVGGYAVFETKTREEAVELVSRFMEIHRQNWPGWEGESEMRQIYDQP